MGVKSLLKRFVERLLDRGLDAYAAKSYSQEGEDLLLTRVFSGQKRGFYVDVGAHHPRRFSNTQLLYERGWSGINIEPNPEALPEFAAARRRDINLQVGISDRAGVLTYHCFDDPALNTFDPELVKRRLETTSYRVVRTIEVPVARLEDLLARHVPADRRIDFFTIDAEGHDYAVIQSNDWDRWRPRWVLVESLGLSMQEVMEGEISRFLRTKHYELFAKTYNTLFFRCESEARPRSKTD